MTDASKGVVLRLQMLPADMKKVLEPPRVLATTNEVAKPYGIAVHEGVIFVSDESEHRVVAFLEDLRYSFEWGSFGSEVGEFNTPQGMCIMRSAIYIADSLNHRVQCFTTTQGTFVRTFGAFGDDAGDFNEPRGLAACPLSHRGNSKLALLVAEGMGKRVQMLTPVGEPLQVVPLPGATRLCEASLSLGRRYLYVTDEKANCVYALSVRFAERDESISEDDSATIDELLKHTMLNLAAKKARAESLMTEEERMAAQFDLLTMCFSRWCEIPAEERDRRTRMAQLVTRMKRRTEILVVQSWHEYVQRSKRMIRQGVASWMKGGLAVSFRTWKDHLAMHGDVVAYSQMLLERSAEYMPKAKLFNAYFEWMRYTLERIKAAREGDRQEHRARDRRRRARDGMGLPALDLSRARLVGHVRRLRPTELPILSHRDGRHRLLRGLLPHRRDGAQDGARAARHL